jgi:hypothetical protein
MPPLGKSLVFALKYPAEMSRLYWTPKDSGNDPDLSGLDEAQAKRVVNMASAVGEAACEEAADFLEVCADRIEEYLRTLQFKTVTRPKRGIVKRRWFFRASVEPVTGKSGWRFEYGVSIRDDLGVAVPWVWRSGGRAWEETVMRVLGPHRAHSRAGGGLVFDRGTVALARIPMLENLSGFDVDRGPLVERVVQAFTAIKAKDLEDILGAVSEEVEEATEDASHLSESVLADLRRRWVACEDPKGLAREARMTILGLQKALGFGR